MNTETINHELLHGMKYMQHNNVKDIIASKVCQCIISDFQYANLIQMEILDALSDPDKQTDFIAKYGAKMREMIEEERGIEEMLLLLMTNIGSTNETRS